MSESEAEFYQSHRDDPEEWGEPVRPQAPSRRLASMISVRFSPDEAHEVRAAAAAAGQSLSNFVRHAALQQARREVAVTWTAAVPADAQPAVDYLRTLETAVTIGGSPMSEASDGWFLAGDLASQAA